MMSCLHSLVFSSIVTIIVSQVENHLSPHGPHKTILRATFGPRAMSLTPLPYRVSVPVAGRCEVDLGGKRMKEVKEF